MVQRQWGPSGGLLRNYQGNAWDWIRLNSGGEEAHLAKMASLLALPGPALSI